MATTAHSIFIPRRLDYLPVGLFGSIMGLAGLSVAWKLAPSMFGLPPMPAVILTGVAAGEMRTLSL